MSKDFMLPFARQLRMMARDNNALGKATEKLTARQQRLTTAFKDLIDQTFQGGLAESIGRLFDLTTKFVRWITPFFKSVMIGVGQVVGIVGEAVHAIFDLIDAVFTLGDNSPSVITKGWWGVKAFFAELAAIVWDVIGAVQYLAALLEGEVGLQDIGKRILDNIVSSGAEQEAKLKAFNANLTMGANSASIKSGQPSQAISVQGDVVVKYDGSQSVVDDIITQFGF